VNTPKITVAMSPDPRTLPLIEKKVAVESYELVISHDFLSPGQQHHRFENMEFDVCEFSTATFLRSIEAKAPFIAIPVFFTRGARHRNIFYRQGSLKHPSDLRGGKIGLSRYGATANVWARGLLLDEYGLKTTEMRWYVSGQELFFAHDLPVTVERPETPMQFGGDRDHLGGLLSQGKIDGVILPGDTGYHSIFGGGPLVRAMESFPGVKPLLDDTEDIIRYIRTRRIYPIMHTIAMKAETAERYPDLPVKLLEAFREAKRLSPHHMSAEDREGYQKEQAVLGEDPYAYVLGKTEIESLKALNRYQIEQGLMKQELDIRSLFVRETVAGC
jgi:4,5-dihydroxyphthalate decarboxylase